MTFNFILVHYWMVRMRILNFFLYAFLNFPVKFASQSTPRGVYPWEPGGVVYKGSAKFLQNLF